jgi:tetratricopeptide (TPR) repeat protein
MKSKKEIKDVQKSAETQARSRSWENIAVAFCLLLLFLLWFTSFFPEKRLWGINHWAYFPLWLRTLVIAAAFLMFFPVKQRKLSTTFASTRSWILQLFTDNPKLSGYLTISVVFLLIFIVFRTRTHFLGDGFQILDKINSGTLSLKWDQPLAIWIYLNAYHLLHPAFNLNGASVYALVSYLAGIIYVIFTLKLANLLGKSPTTRLFIFLMLILMGSSELFFSYAEHYPLLCSGILIYLFYSLKYLRGQTKVFIPAIIFLILLPLHFSSLYLLPSLLYLLLIQRVGKRTAYINKNKIMWWALLGVLLLFLCLALYVRKYNWFVFSYLLPILPGGGVGANYTLFSPDHIVDFINQQFLISPVGFTLCLTFLLLQPRTLDIKSRTFLFLLIVSLAQILFNFIINPGLGAPRDWDLFASVSLGYTVLALYILSQVQPDSKPSPIRAKLILVAFLFTLPWILINARPDKSVARFRNLLDLDPQKSRNGHYILATYFTRTGKPDEMDKENRKIKEIFPELDLVNQGLGFLQKGDLNSAYQRFTQSLQISPDFAEVHYGLAWYYIKTGDLPRSELEFEKAIQLKPDYPDAYADLGDVYMQEGKYNQAEKVYTQAISLGIEIPHMLNNMGNLYAQLGNPDRAISYYQKAIAQKKDFAQAYYGLALIYYQQGNLEESLRKTDQLLQIDPYFALGYNQLGLVYERLGRKMEAASAYQRYLEMQPNDPKAAEIKQLIEILKRD